MKTISSEIQNGISEEIRGWYESSREIIPSIDNSNRFASFLGASSSLAAESSRGSSLGYRFIIDLKSPTAYINKRDRIIAIPAWYFSEEALCKLTSLTGDDNLDLESIALALVNGSQIHEGLHSLHTPETMEEFFNYLSAEPVSKMRASGQVATSIMNVTEDFYIEGRGHDEVTAAVMQFVDMKNGILFSEKDFRENVGKMDKGTDEEKLEARINTYTSLKNIEIRQLAKEDPAFYRNSTVAKLMEIASAVSYRTLAESMRADYMRHAFEFITKGISYEAIKKLDAKMGGGGKGDKRQIVEIDPDLFEGELELSEEEMEKLEAIAAEFENSSERSQKVTRIEFAKRTVKPSADKFSYHGLKTQYIDDIFSIASTGVRSGLEPTSANYSFLSLLKQLRSRNHTPGAARKSGTNIVGSRLYRIGTDQKIFARKDMIEEKDHKVQVAILIDASGSMGRIYTRVISEAASIFTALKKSNIPTVAYAHSGMPRNHGIPALYRIASSGVNGTDYDISARFTRALSIDLNQNYDGIILDAVSTIAFHGTPETTKKIIFVLSDGYPEGDDYHGMSAENHTKDVIKSLRSQGFSVVALSLVDHVVANNDDIYGKDMNVDASKNMKSKFEALIIKLQKEGNL